MRGPASRRRPLLNPGYPSASLSWRRRSEGSNGAGGSKSRQARCHAVSALTPLRRRTWRHIHLPRWLPSDQHQWTLLPRLACRLVFLREVLPVPGHTHTNRQRSVWPPCSREEHRSATRPHLFPIQLSPFNLFIFPVSPQLNRFQGTRW
jgi:hypothetical protein